MYKIYVCLILISLILIVNGGLHRVTMYRKNEEKTNYGQFWRDIKHWQIKYAKIKSLKESSALYGTGSYAGLVNMTHYLNLAYYIEVYIGSPPQRFTLGVDTASSNVWIPSKHCSFFSLACWIHNTYNHEKSSSYTPIGEKVEFKYATDSVKGYTSMDQIKVGDIVIKNQTFGEAVEQPSWTISSALQDGILGLAFPILSDTGMPIHYTMYHQGLLPNLIFSMYFNRNEDEKFGGELIFGGYLTNVFDESTLKYINLTKNMYWEFKFDKLVIGELEIDLDHQHAIADSGSKFIIGQKEIVNNLYRILDADVRHDGTASVECNKIDQLPAIDFVIGNTRLRLNSSDYIIKVREMIYKINCYIGIIGMELEENQWIFGNTFLKKFYTIYDAENGRIGFAELK